MECASISEVAGGVCVAVIHNTVAHEHGFMSERGGEAGEGGREVEGVEGWAKDEESELRIDLMKGSLFSEVVDVR